MTLCKKKGFTLAEVLIVLAILGVVAALSTPGIIRNSQNAKIGPSLARICTTIETAIQAACHEQERYSFKDIVNVDSSPEDLTIANKFDYLAKNFMRAKNYNGTIPPIYNMKNESYDDKVDKTATLIFADKSLIILPSCTMGSSTDGEGNVTTVDMCEAYAVVSGFQGKKKLVLGQDVFPLMITADGYVLPPGQAKGEDHSADCTDEQIDSKTTDGYYCGDRVANNGWKADWK